MMTTNGNEAVGSPEPGGCISGPSFAPGLPDRDPDPGAGPGIVLPLQGCGRLRAPGSPARLAADRLPERFTTACTAASLARSGPQAACSPG